MKLALIYTVSVECTGVAECGFHGYSDIVFGESLSTRPVVQVNGTSVKFKEEKRYMVFISELADETKAAI